MKQQLSIEAFADWCEKQPADREYDFNDCIECACGRFAALLGIDYNEIYTESVIRKGSPFWRSMDDAACHQPHTFGALAARLRAAQ